MNISTFFRITDFRHSEFLSENGGHLTRNADNAVAVRTVCRYGEINDDIPQSENIPQIRSGGAVLMKDQNPVHTGSRIIAFL